jgi:hypothetical protein
MFSVPYEIAWLKYSYLMCTKRRRSKFSHVMNQNRSLYMIFQLSFLSRLFHVKCHLRFYCRATISKPMPLWTWTVVTDQEEHSFECCNWINSAFMKTRAMFLPMVPLGVRFCFCLFFYRCKARCSSSPENTRCVNTGSFICLHESEMMARTQVGFFPYIYYK